MGESIQITSSVSRVGILRSTVQVYRSFLEQAVRNVYTEIQNFGPEIFPCPRQDLA